LAFATRAEAEVDAKGNIKVEHLQDGAGTTVVGMTSRDEQISDNPTPHEIVAGYWKYWTKSESESLPLGVGEVVADLSLVCGMGRAAQWLQRGISDTGIPIQTDGIIGEDTIAKAWKLNSDQLADDIVEQAIDHFHRIATGTRVRFLKGWINRAKALKEFIA
jgi:lysozyme family protein